MDTFITILNIHCFQKQKTLDFYSKRMQIFMRTFSLFGLNNNLF